MSPFEAFILGLIQGLAEFLPISSSGHLELGQFFLGFKNLDTFVFFNLICHLGTLLALIIVFFDKIKAAFCDQKKFWFVVVGTLPLFPLVLILKPLKAMFDQPQYLGFCFLFTAFMLFLNQRKKQEEKELNWKRALTVGLFQAVAILPGVSRSGTTISAGKIIGLKQQDSITFAFLLAIPAILGGVVLETLHLYSSSESSNIPFSQYAIGFITSFIFGYFSLKLLMTLAEKNKFIYFVWYCALLGIGTIIYFN